MYVWQHSLPNFDGLNELKPIAFCQLLLISWMCILTVFVTRIFKPPSHNSGSWKGSTDGQMKWRKRLLISLNNGRILAKSTVGWTPTGTKWSGQEAPNLAQNNCKETKLLLPYCKEKRFPLHLKQISCKRANKTLVQYLIHLIHHPLAYLHEQTRICLHLPTKLVLIEQKKNPKQVIFKHTNK